jgi:SAM-dependent methyltransferase
LTKINSPSEWEKLNLRSYAESAISSIPQSAKAGRNGLASDGSIEEMIVEDVFKKISQKTNQDILDLGCGCGPLASLVIERCALLKHSVTMMDQRAVISELEQLIQTSEKIKLINGIFPYDSTLLGSQKFDSIILYGVMQYATDPINFVLSLIEFLRPGGHLLVGDIPNSDKKRRFLMTEHGMQIDKKYRLTFEPNKDVIPRVEIVAPPIDFNDKFVSELLAQVRGMACESFLLPQAVGLPFCFTREDLLIVKNLE